MNSAAAYRKRENAQAPMGFLDGLAWLVDYQVRKARHLSALEDASERAEEEEQVIDNGHFDVEVENAGTVTI